MRKGVEEIEKMAKQLLLTSTLHQQLQQPWKRQRWLWKLAKGHRAPRQLLRL